MSGEAVAQFAAMNKDRLAHVNDARPVIRSQRQVFPNFLAYMIGKSFGKTYNPVMQVTTLDGRVFTETVEMLK